MEISTAARVRPARGHAPTGARPGPATTNPATTNAVDRALAVLCAFSRESPSLGVTELSARLGLTKSTVHRLLRILAARGMVAQDAAQRSYALGYRVLALAQAVPGEATLRQVCRPHMRWLCSVTQETIGLYVVAGDVRMCLDEVESPQMLRMAAGVGRCFPLAGGAASKALLAEGPAQSELWRMATASLPAERQAWLMKEVEALHERGYTWSVGETVPGAASLAAPICGAGGEIVAALSVAAPATRLDPRAIARHGDALLEAVAHIARDLEAAGALRRMPGSVALAQSSS